MNPQGEPGFSAADGGYLAHLGEVERAVLAEVADQVIELLGGVIPGGELHPLQTMRLEVGPVSPPPDAALHRLLPDGSRGDPELAAEFRRLTEGDLRATKTANLSLLRSLLAEPEAVLPSTDAPRVAAAMTDLRLVIAERLGVQTEADAEELYQLTLSGGDAADPDDGMRLMLATVSTILGILLESLIELMTDELP